MSEPNAIETDDRLPSSKEELLERIQFAWTDLGAVIAALPAEVLAAPGPTGWSVKDNLAHVAAWEQVMLRHYLRREPAHEVLGVDEARLPGLDEDGINQILHERHQDRPASEVLDEFHRSHEQVVRALEGMAWDDLTAPNPGDQERRPLLEWVVGNTYDHYDEHRDNIIRLQTPSVLGD
jgi:hypothetical protein